MTKRNQAIAQGAPEPEEDDTIAPSDQAVGEVAPAYTELTASGDTAAEALQQLGETIAPPDSATVPFYGHGVPCDLPSDPDALRAEHEWQVEHNPTYAGELLPQEAEASVEEKKRKTPPRPKKTT